MAWFAVAAHPSAADESPVVAEAESGQVQERADQQPHEQPIVQRAELDLLNQIRSEIGSPIDASVFDVAADVHSDTKTVDRQGASFDAAYTNAAVDDQHRPTPLDDRFEYRSPRWDYHQAEPSRQFEASLRDAARRLETTAADLEDAAEFERADLLRNLATKLRRKARQSVLAEAAD